MSDIERLAREKGLSGVVGKVTLKQDKLRQLFESELPQYEGRVLPYSEFNERNKELMDFFKRHLKAREGFCVRALPTREGCEKGLVRRFKLDFMDFKDCKDFLTRVIVNLAEYYDVGINCWVPSTYGGVIISSRNILVGEIATDLVKLTSGEETPIAGFSMDREAVHTKGDRIVWYGKDGIAKRVLWRALGYIGIGEDRFNPIAWGKGYYEFISRKDNGKVMFVDYDPQSKLLD